MKNYKSPDPLNKSSIASGYHGEMILNPYNSQEIDDKLKEIEQRNKHGKDLNKREIERRIKIAREYAEQAKDKN